MIKKKYHQSIVSLILCTIIQYGCGQEDFRFEKYSEIPLTAIFSDSICEEFLKQESNYLGKYSPLSFALNHGEILIPNRVNNNIGIFEKSDITKGVKKTIEIEFAPALIELFDSNKLAYSSYEVDSIFIGERSIYSSTPLFKTYGQEILSFSHGKIISTDRSFITVNYNNIYTDWDFHMISNQRLSVLEVDHENFFACFLILYHDGSEFDRIEIPEASTYNTYKILGEIRGSLILFLSDKKDIEIIEVDTQSLTITNRVKYSNPFSSSPLFLGEYSTIWPDQFICKIFNSSIYVMGTTRKSIQLFEAKW